MSSEESLQLAEKLISEAESLFGKSLNEWSFGGIEINDRPPSLKYYIEIGVVNISLSTKVNDDDEQFVFQLSHEICHLLHPGREFPSLILNPTLVINEGVSTYFSILKMEEFYKNADVIIENLKTYSKKYYDSYKLVKELLDFDNDSIKKLRKLKPRIDKITLKDFDIAKIKATSELKEKLVTVFN